ncbi:MAG: hypothetical protein AYK22_04530 [Thermoplasmatales archaeon SG8-52-3]|nr:MAG: hypothetical protein AYK22_04530 [Thermoplasmatales archaeon SG8-52-3]
MTKCCSKDTVKVLFADMTVNKSKAYIEALPKNTLEIVKKYDTLKKMNGCTQKTRRNYIRLMLQFAKETGKPFDKISKDDIDTFIVKRNGNTLEQYKLDIKAFFTWFGKLELVSHLKHLKQAEKRKPKDAGLPSLRWETELPIPGINMSHCKLSKDGIYLYCYENHPDYKKAQAKGSTQKTRYIANLYAKELAKKHALETRQDFGEVFLDILSKMDRMW